MRRFTAVLPVLLAAACATAGEKTAEAGRPGTPQIDRAARTAIERQDTLTQMTFWAQEYAVHPQDLETAQKFVDALRYGGRADRAATVALEALEKHPDDRKLMRSYGLALLASGKPRDALRPLALAAQGDAKDWSIRSALGAALDQVGRPVEARQAYREALAIKADDAGVLTNMGVSFLMTGDMADAEKMLQQAAALPGASAETRMNLSIAIALQGRFEEAERIQRIDVPPDMIAANMAYLRALQTDPRRWGELQSTKRRSAR
jgi:Flp pilus assembly protein TadD